MKFTYYTMIGKDIDMLKGHIDNIKNYAGFDKLTCDKEFIVIVYSNNNIDKKITGELIRVCHENAVRPVLFKEASPDWLTNLYTSWNLGYSEASEGWVFRSGSDQVHSKDSLPKLYDVAMRKLNAGEKFIINSNTIEHSVRAMSQGNVSRHLVKNFGDSFQTLDLPSFERYVDEINSGVTEELLTIADSIRYWGKPTPFRSTIKAIHNRTEGCSWLITKDDWKKFGPMPARAEGLTGDCWLHDQFEKAGYRDYLARDCVTYHFFRGESYNG